MISTYQAWWRISMTDDDCAVVCRFWSELRKRWSTTTTPVSASWVSVYCIPVIIYTLYVLYTCHNLHTAFCSHCFQSWATSADVERLLCGLLSQLSHVSWREMLFVCAAFTAEPCQLIEHHFFVFLSELSHRSSDFTKIITRTEDNLRKLL